MTAGGPEPGQRVGPRPGGRAAEGVPAGWRILDIGPRTVAAFGEALNVAGAITPVPGGVGQMTVACLLVNTLRAACAIHGLPKPVV